jgi:hypothetical protein
VRRISVSTPFDIGVIINLIFLIHDRLARSAVSSRDMAGFVCDQKSNATGLVVLVPNHDRRTSLNDAGHSLK